MAVAEPAPRPRRRLAAGERRTLILSAAAKLFARDGYELASMDEIASASGVTKPVLYDHFPSKQALFLAVLAGLRDALIARGSDAVAGEGPPARRIAAAVEGFFDFVQHDPDAARLLFMAPAGDAEARAISQAIQRVATLRLAELLRQLAPIEPGWRAEAAAEFCKRGLHAIAAWWLEHPDVDRRELSALAAGLIARGVAAA